MKVEYPYFTDQKFFTPHTSFSPPIFALQHCRKSDIFIWDFLNQRGDKKLEGWGKKLFICTVWISSFRLHKN